MNPYYLNQKLCLALRHMRRAAAVSTAGLFLLASCAPGSGLPPLPANTTSAYRLGAGERVRVIIFGQTQLTGEFRINDNGTISVPLLGAIPADGLTTTRLEHEIAMDLQEKKILLNPSVSVEIIEYRPIFILGEVAKPGQYPYEPGMTVLTAVAIAGGFTYRAQTGYASILRRIDNHAFEGRVTRGEEVVPGDVITIFERYF
jgi:polysaccharide export outer membrane protein